MAEYVAFDSNVEVLGAVLLTFFSSAGESIRPVAEKHGLVAVEPRGWYPQQFVLDLYREIAHYPGGMFDLVSIGMGIPEQAAFPSGINSIESALLSLDVAYHMNHRGGDIGYYRATPVGPAHMLMECRNPYPSDFDYGVLYGLVRRFRSHGVPFTVQRDDSLPSRKHGADVCTYHVTWGGNPRNAGGYVPLPAPNQLIAKVA